MDTPKIDLKDIAKQARADAFSTKDYSGNDIPSKLHFFKEQFNKARQKCVNKIQSKLAGFEKKISACEAIRQPSFIKKQLEKKTTKFLNFNPETHRSNIKIAYDQFKRREGNYEIFKRQHNRTLEPIRVDNQKIGWFIILCLFSIEVIVNYNLFLPVTGNSDAGGNLAKVLSASQSFANVFTGFLVGKFLWGKALFSQSVLSRFYALLLSVIHLIFVLWINLAIGLWRAIITTNSQGTTVDNLEMAMNPIKNILYFRGEMDAILVSVVGIVFAIIAYLDGWFSDDPYPQYGDRYREVKKAQGKLEDVKKALYQRWDEVIESYEKISTQFFEEANTRLNEWDNAINALQKEFTDWTNDLLAAEKSYSLAVKTYQTAFNKSHNDKDKKISISQDLLWDKPQSDPKLVFEDAAAHYLTDSERKIKFRKLKSEYSQNFENMMASWAKYNKETTVIIDKLIKDYAS